MDRPDFRIRIDGVDSTAKVLSAEIQMSLETIASTFSIQVMVPYGDPFPYYRFASVELYDGNDLILKGYLEQPDDSFAPDGSQTSLPGKSITGHIVESSAVLEGKSAKGELAASDIAAIQKRIAKQQDSFNAAGPGGLGSKTLTDEEKAKQLKDMELRLRKQLRSASVVDIINEIAAPYGIPVKVGSGVDIGKRFRGFRLNDGETAVEAIARAAKERDLIIYTETGAEIVIGQVTDEAPRAIVPGNNVEPISGGVGGDATGLGSTYIVTGHGAHHLFGDKPDKHVARFDSPHIPVYRPIVVMAQTGTKADELIKQAKRLANAREGRALTVGYQFPGWRAPDGGIWMPNQMYHVRDERLRLGNGVYVDEPLVASTVVLTMEHEAGANASVEFKRRGAFLSE